MAAKAQNVAWFRARLICLVPPSAQHEGRATEFGLQDKDQLLHSGITLSTGALQFECTVTVANLQSGTPRFGGPFAHGKPGDQFLYLGWRPQGGTSNPWIRRGKISLSAIGLAMIEHAVAGEGLVLQASVHTLDAARPKLLDGGWALLKA